jgi:hypothetical protein
LSEVERSAIHIPVMREPNFFIVGAPKAGTTSLYHYLDQHPDIYMSPLKEPCYFSFEMRPENFQASLRDDVVRVERDVLKYLHGPMDRKRSSGIVSAWPDYLRLFAAATTQQAVGEASVTYLWSKTAATAIAARIPRARIVMVLRSPAERAFSQYLQNVSDGHTSQPFRAYVRESLRNSGEGLGIHEPFLEMGFYADQVQRYLDHFPREQIGIWLYEAAKTRPREFMQDVLEFLEVDSTFTPDTSKRYHEPRVPWMIKPNRILRRARMSPWPKRLIPSRVRSLLKKAIYRPTGSVMMEPEDRALMLDFYRSDIHRLEGILNRDLSAWLA